MHASLLIIKPPLRTYLSVCPLIYQPTRSTPHHLFIPHTHHTKGITRESPSKGYFPFGYSTRSCIGATLALIEGTVMITLLAQRYTFKEVRKQDAWFVCEAYVCT